MADDVKVKFGGDFTDVAKGANDAAKKAGTALGDWFGDFRKSMATQIASGLALTALVGKFVQSASESLQYFREMDLTMRRLGTSGAEFQKLARFGKEAGVSMENVARSLNFFNLYSKKAAEGNETHARSLKLLGFTQKDIKDGNVNMTEAIMKLADMYDATGNETLIAAKAMEIFGMRGKDMIPIIKSGREQIREMTKDMAVLSAQAIKELSATQLRIERAKKQLENTFVLGPLEWLGQYYSAREGRALTEEAIATREEGGGTVAQQARSQAASIASNAPDLAALKEAAKAAKIESERFGYTEEDHEFARQLAENLEKIIKKKEETPDKAPVITPLLPASALTASSLQEIGGGDISSVLSGTYSNDMLDAARRTAENTAAIAAKDPSGRPTLTVTK
jgi:hypothetical protein